ncbi:protein shisa-5-like [Lineus longissimus]|uniref:protein shisa-5-like n=1 Tax=Lineus longissimus TaxID=88925 RepID=UPI002B4E65E4
MERFMKLSVVVLVLAICIFAFLPSGNSRTYKRVKRAALYGTYYRASYSRYYYRASYYGGSYYGTRYSGGASSLTIGLVVGSITLVVIIVGIVLCLKFCKRGQRQNRVTAIQGGTARQPPPGYAGPPPAYPGSQPLYPMPTQPYSVQPGPAYNQAHPAPPYPPPAVANGAVDAAYPPGIPPKY